MPTTSGALIPVYVRSDMQEFLGLKKVENQTNESLLWLVQSDRHLASLWES